VQSAAFAVASSARGAIIPRIVPADLVPAANTLSFTLGNLGGVIGPLIAGVLVSLDHGFEYAYAVDAVLFLAALYSALRLPRRVASRRAGPDSGRSLRACASSPDARC
jgi:MFS family permease